MMPGRKETVAFTPGFAFLGELALTLGTWFRQRFQYGFRYVGHARTVQDRLLVACIT